MLLPWRKLPSGRHNGSRALRCLACIWLSTAGVACSAFIDQELSGKDAGSGADGSDGSGGAPAGTTSSTSPTSDGGGGQTATTTTTPPETTTSTSTTECTGPIECHLANAMAGCAGGLCKIDKCHLGYGDCNKDRLDGCEAELWHDDANCGKCGEECKDGKECAVGDCK